MAKILLTGGTGFIADSLVPALSHAGHRLTIYTRQRLNSYENVTYINNLSELEEFAPEAVINLAGASMAGRRWSRAYKQELLASRLKTTHDLVATMGSLDKAPAVLISASAVGYYGHQGDAPLDETADGVSGFSQDLCQRWEQEALKAEGLGMRVCLVRLGVVLDREGGAMDEMRKSYKLGVASWMGDGQQWLSWVHRSDVVRAILLLLEREDLSGPFNLTAPEPVTGRQFAETLGKYIKTFLTMPIPGPVLRLMLGEMAEELLLNGQRVIPKRLQEAGFEFNFPTLDQAFADIV